MKLAKKTIPLIVVLSFLMVFTIMGTVNAINYDPAPINDFVDDVLKVNISDLSDYEIGDFVDGIDIVSLIRSGQNVSITFQANWLVSSNNATCNISIDSNLDGNDDYKLVWNTSNEVFIYRNSTDNYWNGTHWSALSEAISIGEASGTSITANVSTAITLNGTEQYYAITGILVVGTTSYTYGDYAPALPYDIPQVPGFTEILVIVGLLGAITALLIHKRKTIIIS
ncbi:MAG: hypothetical protein EAX96_07775 [Candidatus Lokiarchaeota archaeon]|nr:hypothetical protein [Candidatus Lokiarchaeota archaeon]